MGAAVAAEVRSLATSLKTKIAHARSRNNRNRIEMAKDLTKATKALYEKAADMQKAQMGASNALKAATAAAATATAKAVEQRIAAHLKSSKRFLQVELANRVEEAADKVFKTVNGKRQKIADNYLSFKAYAVASLDKVTTYTAKGKGRNLSSIGDLLMTVGALAAVKAPKAEGLGFGGSRLPALFAGKVQKVPNALARINGLVNEYATSCAQVRARWPMGLGKYLLDKLEVSMSGKGVLQVDKVSGKAGNFVYVNGRSVGLSNKLNDFATLASRMSVYEAVLAKLTSKLTVGPKTKKAFSVKPPEWKGN